MKIAIDIDEVIAEFVKTYIEFVNKKETRQVQFEDIHTYKLWKNYNIEKEKAYEYAKELEQTKEFGNIQLVEGAKEAIQSLQQNNEVLFITARNKRLQEKTHTFIETKLGIQNPTILHSSDDYHEKNGTKTKGDYCKELYVDILIEDNPDFFTDHLEEQLQVILLDKPWNQGLEHKNLYRCNNWKIITKINELHTQTLV